MTVLLGEIESDLRNAEERGFDRFSVRLGLWAPEKANRALIYNLSQSGMLLRVERELVEGEQIRLRLPVHGLTRATVVRVEELYVYGCEFDVPISQSVISAALMEGGYDESQIGR
ncbi:hypothetical protein FHS61_002548 [Altererythrobacter atlanticus]|uniref:PilZ domain protein n=1 Tax=Croceibacterium atlanticum TaxID=1267766 RepID=A0A0F7KS30_9SPHN|nr:PilZ domain-containing protein [Croceibacterium atlanticum]AKH41921.1 PilZ domain protein [Croceibacterium atlanticum]MBB5733513.1 hypothetical protein [Croceibacterium atlanticum]